MPFKEKGKSTARPQHRARSSTPTVLSWTPAPDDLSPLLLHTSPARLQQLQLQCSPRGAGLCTVSVVCVLFVCLHSVAKCFSLVFVCVRSDACGYLRGVCVGKFCVLICLWYVQVQTLLLQILVRGVCFPVVIMQENISLI